MMVASAESATNLRELSPLEACILLPILGQVTRTWFSVKGKLWKLD